MLTKISKNHKRNHVHDRIRKKMQGTAERPRLNVYRSLNHIYVQVIDDLNGKTLVSASTAEGKKEERRTGGNVASAKAVGKIIAERAKAQGVTKGWTRELEIVGIGYRAEMKGKGVVVFNLGYSHPIEYPLPTGVDAVVDPKQTRITLTCIDRQKVGQVAAEMRALRPPDPYKNKGVRYAGERLKKKVGKTGAK